MNNDFEGNASKIYPRTVQPAVVDQGLLAGAESLEEGINSIVQQVSEGAAAKAELAVLKPVLAYALSKLERKQLRVRAEEMDTLAEKYTMQAKSDGQGGIVLRSVVIL